jgi:hypothetical protein
VLYRSPDRAPLIVTVFPICVPVAASMTATWLVLVPPVPEVVAIKARAPSGLNNTPSGLPTPDARAPVTVMVAPVGMPVAVLIVVTRNRTDRHDLKTAKTAARGVRSQPEVSNRLKANK